MLELISDISMIQWIFIGLGLLIAAPALLDAFSKLGDNIPSGISTNKQDNGLTDLVGQWESLYDSCKQEGLEEACSTLDEVFPLLRERKNS